MKMKKLNKAWLPLIAVAALSVFACKNFKDTDWSQWRGHNRTGVSGETGLNLDWSAKKPALNWVYRKSGYGYSAPAVVGPTLYCQGGSNGKDFAFALDVHTGKEKWKQELGAEFEQDRGNGPRGSVTVDGDRLYLIRGGGQIHCLAAADGKTIWQKDFKTDFDGNLMSNWGYSESPVIDGNLVICSPGGDNGTMMALDKNTGAPVWRTKEWTDRASHSSAIVAEAGGIRQYIQQGSKGVAGISAKDGKLLWQIDYPPIARPASAVIPTPVFDDNMVYVTNGSGNGCMGIRLTKAGDGIQADTVYTGKIIENHHGGVVLINGHVYGYAERPANAWVCQHIKTGEIVWSMSGQDAGIGKGAVLGIGDRLLCQDERTGLLVVAAASPDGWKEFGRMEFPERTDDDPSRDKSVWTHPVVANGQLYLRDHDLLFCLDLK